MVARLTSVEGKLAVGTRAQAGLIGGGEGLWEGCKAGSQHWGQGFRVASGNQVWARETVGCDRSRGSHRLSQGMGV